MTNFLDSQGIPHKIFVCHQADGKKFNRGKTKNIAYDIAQKEGFDYFAFHDIDLLPEEDSCQYSFPETAPLHLSTQIDKFDYQLPYMENFGGVVLFNKQDFIRVNGYSNEYWGWGAEDDDLFWRCKNHNLADIRFLSKELENQVTASFNGRNSGIKIPGRGVFGKLTNGSFTLSMLVRCEGKKDFPLYLKSDPKSQYLDMPLISRRRTDFLAYNNTSTYNGIINNHQEEVSELWCSRDLGLWTLLTLRVDSEKQQVSLYLNGSPEGVYNTKGDQSWESYGGSLFQYFNSPYQIGYRRPSFMDYLRPAKLSQNFFKGQIARIGLWEGALEGSDLLCLLDESPKKDRLKLYYDFNKIQNNQVLDQSGNGNHGTLRNITLEKNNIGIIKSALPYRIEAKYKSLPHKSEGYGKPSEDMELIRKNEARLVRELKQGLVDTSMDGLNDLDYRVLDKTSLQDGHVMLNVQC